MQLPLLLWFWPDWLLAVRPGLRLVASRHRRAAELHRDWRRAPGLIAGGTARPRKAVGPLADCFRHPVSPAGTSDTPPMWLQP